MYVVLYRSLKDEISQGHLKANQKLTSKRNLAQHLMISVITVENAYSQLVLEGYVYTKEKSGYFVCPMQETVSNPLNNVPCVVMQRQKDRVYFADFETNSICPEKFTF